MPHRVWRDGVAGGTPLSADRLNGLEGDLEGQFTAAQAAVQQLRVEMSELKSGVSATASEAVGWIPAASFVGGTLTTVPGTTVPAVSFADAATGTVSALLDLPDDWPTRAHVELLWVPADGTAGNVVWRAGVQNYAPDVPLAQAALLAPVAQAAGGTALMVRSLYVGAVTIAPQLVTNLVVSAVAADAADTYVGTRYLLGARLLKTAPAAPPPPPPSSGAGLITPTVLTSGVNNADASSYTTASVSPAANRLLIFAVTSSDNSGSSTATAPLATPTGLGLTWTKLIDEPFSSTNGVRRLTLWTATTGGTAPTPGSIAIDMGGIMSSHASWALTQIEGADTATPILQPKAVEGAGGTQPKLTMAAPRNTSSRPFAVFSWRTAENAVPEAGWTELWDVMSPSNPSLGFLGAWNPDSFDTTLSLAITSDDWAAVGLELAASNTVAPAPETDAPAPAPTPSGGGGSFAEFEQADGGPRTADLFQRSSKVVPVGTFTTKQVTGSPAANTTFDMRGARYIGYFWADSQFGFGEFKTRTATSHELNHTPFIYGGSGSGATAPLLLGGIVEGDQNPNLTWNSMKHGSHIQDAIDGGMSGDQAWSMIVDNQNMDGDPRVYIASGSFAVIAGLRTRHTMDGFGVYGPEGSDTRSGDGTAYFRNCWFTDVHDDGIENDRQRKVKITDCLFERTYTFLSTRAPDTSGSPQATKTQEVRDSIVWLHPRPGPYKQPTSSVKHDLIYKMQANSPGLSMKNVIIGASAPRGTSSLQLPTRSGLDSYENVTIVWMGTGSYPGNVPPGVTVTTDAAVLTNAVANWKARHGVIDFERVDMNKMLSPASVGGVVNPTPTPAPGPAPTPPPSGTVLATPGLIDGIEPEAHSHHPVYADANGMLYRITESYTSEARHNEPKAMKSTDQGLTWSEKDAAGRSTHNDLEGGWCMQSTGLVHYCWNDGSRMSYSAFATSDNATVADRDTWVVQREDFSTGMSAGSQQYSSMCRTSDGRIWFFFQDTVSGSNRQISYCRRTGPSSYSAKVKVGTTSENLTCPVPVVGANDVTHLFYTDFTARQLRYRTLTSAGVLSAAVRPDTTGTPSRAFPLSKPVYYDNAGTEVISVVFRNTAGELKSIQVIGGVVQAEQLVNAGPVTQSPTGSGNDGSVSHLAVRGTTLYAIWANATSGDVFYSSRPHGGTWTAATRLWDSGTNECWWVYNNCLTIGGTPYMYYTYDIAPHADGDSNITVNRLPL